ncbi:unnamed protein product [Symbiodinium sp. CCMP2592]|nr:unnamed protein product [Symbiodinium sp. CCMP2592]
MSDESTSEPAVQDKGGPEHQVPRSSQDSPETIRIEKAEKVYGATSELQAVPRESMPALSLAIVGVECDDISCQTSSPKSILDAKGHSGSSFLQFLEFIQRLEWSQRPVGIMWECVKNLDAHRKTVNEKGTEVIKDLMRKQGYVSSFQVVNSKHFALPHSRNRVYGISLKLDLAAPGAEQKAGEKLSSAWFVVPSGDTLQRHKWRTVHPCLLPQKRFLYLDENGLHLNKSPTFVMSLQGLSSRELKAAGLTDLTVKQAQELAGNGFTANVAASVLVSILVHILQ